MKIDWYASVPHAGAACLSPLRRSHGVEVLDEGRIVWLRGPRLDDETCSVLRSVLGCRLYRPLGDGQLVPYGKSLPSGYEPSGLWAPIDDWLLTARPPTRFAVRAPQRVELRLVRSGNEEAPGLVCVGLAEWLAYAATAPQVRLDRLTFAASGDQAVVVGHPLPPLNGQFYWLRSGVAAPVGFTWRPAVDASVVRKLFQLEEGDLALLLRGGGCGVVRGDQFVGASRSAARLTEGAGHVQT